MQVMLPPGTWCTDWAFLRAVAASGARTFLEVGSGEGRVAAALCAQGLTGHGVDPSPEAVAICRRELADEIATGRFTLHAGVLGDMPAHEPVDLVYSQMVLEHVPDDVALVREMVTHVRPGGTVLAVVPARPECWGAEDELAGHVRRYERTTLTSLFAAAGLESISVSSLNVPVSNLLHSLSDRAVAHHNQVREKLELADRTRLSGLRDIPFKNRFPSWARLALNSITMWPLCQLQRAFFATDHGLVLLGRGQRAGTAEEGMA